MIDLIFKKIIENSNRIDSIAKNINKTNKKTCFQILLIATTIYTISRTVKKHENKINELEMELEMIKSNLA